MIIGKLFNMRNILIALVLALFFNQYLHSQETVITKVRCYLLKDFPINEIHNPKLTLGEAKQGTIPKGKELIVLGIDTLKYKMYRIQYKKKIGWVHKDILIDDSYIVKNDPNIREEYRKVVLDNSVAIGMTKHELIQSLGDPIDTNRTITANNVSEQLVYGNIINHYYAVGFKLVSYQTTSDKLYIYLDNGIVTAIQTMNY